MPVVPAGAEYSEDEGGELLEEEEEARPRAARGRSSPRRPAAR